MPSFSRTGKPLCIGMRCRRLATHYFEYRSDGKPVKALYCEACAKEHTRVLCQPLRRIS